MKSGLIAFSGVALSALVFSGCTKPYKAPEFRGAMSFTGASELANDNGSVRVIMTHGMCAQDHQGFGSASSNVNWVGERAGVIAELVGDESFLTKGPFRTYQPSGSYSGSYRSTSVQRFDVDINSNTGKRYELKFLKWGLSFQPLTNSLDILENSIQEKPIERAKLNDTLKRKLMDDCIIDAVAYSGAQGDYVRSAFREALCDLMGGRITGPNNGTPGEKVTCSSAFRSSAPTIIVSESLGSKVMMDAIISLQSNGSLGDIRAIHLATNQLPLLGQAEVKKSSSHEERQVSKANADVPSALRQVPGASDFRNMLLKLQASSPNKTSSDPVSIVVYSDPNDLVGYPLTEDWLPLEAGFKMTNVLISNGDTYFGYIENPLVAHRGTARPGVFKLILNGYDTP